MKKNKFKVGDLVELSAAGKKNEGNALCRGGWGMVMKIDVSGSKYPIICQWPTKNYRLDKSHRFKEYELKRLRPKKTKRT